MERIQEAGLHFVGTDERRQRMEIVELERSQHPFFFAVQYHPEFLSLPHSPSLSFLGFILASAGFLKPDVDLADVPPPLELAKAVRKT